MTGITTERLHLTPFALADRAALTRLYGDPAVMAIRKLGVRSAEQAAADLAAILAHWEAYGFGVFAVRELGQEAVIGECGLRHFDPDEPDAGEVEITYGLFPAAQGRGYATEAARAVLRFGFADIGLARILAVARADNLASHRVMQKLGMRHLGNFAGGTAEIVKYELTREDFAG